MRKASKEILQHLVGNLGMNTTVGGIAPAHIMHSGANFMKAAHELQQMGFVKAFKSPPAPNKMQCEYLVSVRDAAIFAQRGWIELYIESNLTMGKC